MEEGNLSIRIRLRRMGAKKRPFYRFVAADSRSPRDGRFKEVLGYYNPIETPAQVVVKEDRIYYWLKQGALPTDTVNSLFRQIGLISKWEKMKKGEDVTGIELLEKIRERKKKKTSKKRAVKMEAPEAKEEEQVQQEAQPKPEEETSEEEKKEAEKKADKTKEAAPKAPTKESKKEVKAESEGKKSSKKEAESKTEDSEKGKS
jgi:small subunit ribosomal protein S16